MFLPQPQLRRILVLSVLWSPFCILLKFLANLCSKMPRAGYKYCVVPFCKNTTVTNPGKLFISLPKDEKIRKKWNRAAKRSKWRNQISSLSSVYICEDHFDVSMKLFSNSIIHHTNIHRLGNF